MEFLTVKEIEEQLNIPKKIIVTIKEKTKTFFFV